MWTAATNETRTDAGNGNSSKMVEPDFLTRPLLHTTQLGNGSTVAATRPSRTENSTPRTSGIIPGAIAATVFIAFLLALYTVLWKCMVTPTQRKRSKVRVRIQQRTSV